MPRTAIALFSLLVIALPANADGLLPPSASISPAQPPSTQTSSTTTLPTPYSNQEFEKLITITKQVLPLKSNLKSLYSAYKVTLISEYPGILVLRNANINNAVTGSVAAQLVYKSPWKGCLWALIPYAGIIIGPAVAINNGVKNSHAEKESAQYAGQIPPGDLKSGEPISFQALVPTGQMPILTLKFKDKETQQEYVINSI